MRFNNHLITLRALVMSLSLFAVALLMVALPAPSAAVSANKMLSQRRKEVRYELKGLVKSVDKDNRRATIKHEKVADYMDAMTMPFPIRDERALQEMQPGDQIIADLVLTPDSSGWLERIRIIAKASGQESAVKPGGVEEVSTLMGVSGDRTPPPSRFESESTGLYTCSMHLGYRAVKAGKCPRCGMDLISTEPEIEEEFDLLMNATPRVPQPGEVLKLRFTVLNPRTGKTVKEFGLMHDRLFHLFLVSQDMNDFQHIHPQQLEDGSFEIQTRLKRAGLYKVYADIYPLNGAPQFLQTNLSNAGWQGDLLSGQANLTDETLLKTVVGEQLTTENANAFGVDMRLVDAKDVGDLRVELEPEAIPLICGKKLTLKFRLTDATTRQPARDVIPYLGAWGHVLVLSADQTSAIHSHPEETIPEEADFRTVRGGPELSFDLLFPSPGNYRLWMQIVRGSKLFTSAFDLRVERAR